MAKQLTLEEWQKLADRAVFRNESEPTYWIPDTIGLQDSGLRPLLWNLSDYRVIAISGAVIWLAKK